MPQASRPPGAADHAACRSMPDHKSKRSTPDHASRRPTPVGNRPFRWDDGDRMDASAPPRGTCRWVMGTRNSPRRPGMPTTVRPRGPALIVGDNVVADAWVERFVRWGQSAIKLPQDLSLAELDRFLDDLWSGSFTPHLFLTTPHDPDAAFATEDVGHWNRRRRDGLEVPYRVCQRWMQTAIDRGAMEDASLVTMIRGGGQFGFQVDAPESLARQSGESGGMSGLTKAMLIEAWMRGFRKTPMLVIDSMTEDPQRLVDGAVAEWAVPSHDEEVAVDGDTRGVVTVRPRPIERPSSSQAGSATRVRRGSRWVVAGGARGITAYVAMELAQRHNLELHLLGMAPPPQIDPQTAQKAADDRLALRRATYQRVQREGGNPVKFWRQFEKALEIDETLRKCASLGIAAKYHSVNVSDAEQTARLMATIRHDFGPIHGVIQGAGSGQDARFDRKRPDKVRQCLSAKIDGTASLAAATQADPLDWFVGFGSISGRFGANGHTDYSAANDMMAKMITRLGASRPNTRCTTFHWHAWGDIGMATKPEAKLALDMIGMEFMPAEEGLRHFLDELEHGGDESEVLITDRRYVRKFFAAELVRHGERVRSSAASDPNADHVGTALVSADFRPDEGPSAGTSVTLCPTTDPFLREHRVGGRPTLPMVIAIEMMVETAAAAFGSHSFADPDDRSSLVIGPIVAHAPLKFAQLEPMAVEIGFDRDSKRCWVQSDLRRRDGRLVQSGRLHFEAVFEPHFSRQSGEAALDQWMGSEPASPPHADRSPVPYPEIESLSEAGESNVPIYHGPPLRCLQNYAVDDRSLRGTIVAPSPLELAGDHRRLDGWHLPAAVADAALYAAGLLAHHVHGHASLPVRIEGLRIGRSPDPGEPLEVRVWMHAADATGGDMSVAVRGQNGDMILRMHGYRVGWLR